jgi:hypothetical protein
MDGQNCSAAAPVSEVLEPIVESWNPEGETGEALETNTGQSGISGRVCRQFQTTYIEPPHRQLEFYMPRSYCSDSGCGLSML